MNAIELHGLHKEHAPGVGLRPTTLEVPAGQIFGFLGPNGAGKTTTIRTLLGFLRPGGGSARILGHDVWREREAVHACVGYLPGELHLRREHTVLELLRRTARLRGLPEIGAGQAIARRLELDLRTPLGRLSKGNRQKVGLAVALLGTPPVLILDEPTDGLDPLAQETVLELLRDARAEGRTVFLSSHLLGEVERVADRVGIIRAGELIRVETLAALRASLPQRLELRFAAPPRADLSVLPGLEQPRADGLSLRALWHGTPGPLLRALAAEQVESLSLTPFSLEEAFMDEYRAGGHPGGAAHEA